MLFALVVTLTLSAFFMSTGHTLTIWPRYSEGSELDICLGWTRLMATDDHRSVPRLLQPSPVPRCPIKDLKSPSALVAPSGTANFVEILVCYSHFT
ncbi:hypothetical protein Nepgr_006942 [Nepenthes gracilis]|uniref:Secreted protein n=1 Tax=Nepenthes gracilis TaxID=150966 RepID=A0AAD3S6S0_NEPGR|nr:hypothetical protein Nepgr_006942 [Nepenthes gracilis]